MKRQTTGGATREAVKEYLQQYHMARERRRILERRHDVLARELNAPAPGTTYRTMPASRPAADSEGAVSVVFRLSEVEAVSYTHLDVYKRQGISNASGRPSPARCWPPSWNTWA